MTNITNGNSQQYKPLKPIEKLDRSIDDVPVYQSLPPDTRGSHNSRLGTFQSLSHQRNDNQSFLHQRVFNSPHQSTIETTNESPFKTYSPFKAYQNHIAATKSQRERDREAEASSGGSSFYQTNWRSPSGSPLPIRTQRQDYNCGNTSPIILQRFYHQQKQQQLAKEAEESGKN